MRNLRRSSRPHPADLQSVHRCAHTQTTDIPASDFDPASVAFEKVFPTYTGVEAAGKIGGTVNYFQPTTQFYDEYIARVDHDFSDKDHLFGHYYSNYFEQAADYNPAMLSSYRSYFNTRYQNALLSETHSSPTTC